MTTLPTSLQVPRAERDKRRRARRNRTINHRDVRLLPFVPTDHERPQIRSACERSERPCPYVGCKHHLYLDVKRNGSITFNFPDLEPDELTHSCSLDLAALGGLRLEEVGVVLNMTKERVRQIETVALERLQVATPEELRP